MQVYAVCLKLVFLKYIKIIIYSFIITYVKLTFIAAELFLKS